VVEREGNGAGYVPPHAMRSVPQPPVPQRVVLRTRGRGAFKTQPARSSGGNPASTGTGAF